MSVAAIIVAAGRGRRLGSEVPKQYIPLDTRAVLAVTVETFLAVPSIDLVQPVIAEADRDLCAKALEHLSDDRLLPPVTGADTRARSVRQGLEALETHHPDLVLIHDAARPFVSRTLIGQVIAALETASGACAALPVVDAVWKSTDGFADRPIDREGLWRAQTPQGFRFQAILDAHRGHDGSGADDVAVAREAGLDVRFVQGSEQNYKITTAADLERARADIATHQP